MKSDRKNYKGIEYVLFSELSPVQQEKLLQTLGREHFIKIMIDGKIISQCLEFKVYDNWFDNIYNPKVAIPVVKESRHSETISLRTELALK